MLEVNKVYNLDCLNGMSKLNDKSINLIATDLPYGIWNNCNFLFNVKKKFYRI